MNRVLPVALVVGAIGAATALAVAKRGRDEGARCGSGFVADGARCLLGSGACPPPFASAPAGCNAPDLRIPVPSAVVQIGPADWEATGAVTERTIRVAAFRIDAFEVTRGAWAADAGADPLRAASGMTHDDAAAFCAIRGGRLPTEDEWIVAATSSAGPARRYPWGDTGAVCRRAAWGLGSGPCASGANGPDTVGAHSDGDSSLGLHDMAGNVAEWVGPPQTAGPDVAKGGSWQSALASDLRIWARLEIARGRGDPRVGLRCAYPP